MSDDTKNDTKIIQGLWKVEFMQASNSAPIESAVLGAVTWNNDRETWEATLPFAPDRIVAVSLEPLEANANNTILNGEAVITWAKENEPGVRAYAARQLTNLAEEW